jgi:hypothetical protein
MDKPVARCHFRRIMLRPAPYLTQKLTRPIPITDGGMLRTVLHARTYMLGLSRAGELRTQWQRACELLLAEDDVADLSRAPELALYYDAKLDVSVGTASARWLSSDETSRAIAAAARSTRSAT